MTEQWPKFETEITVSSDPNKFGKAVGWCPAYGIGLGFRPNREVVKPDAVFMPEEYAKHYQS